MVSDEENMDRITMEVWEAESHWINILPPDVWQSMKHFTYIDDNNIRFWLKAIKWIWDGPIDKIIDTRQEVGWKFEDFKHKSPAERVVKVKK
jgi:DNA polymerase III alpha subunit